MSEPVTGERAYEVTDTRGNTFLVWAGGEDQARHLAMVEKWGPPPGRCPSIQPDGPRGTYAGRGLTVREAE